MELNELRKIAEQATQGNWMWVNDRTPEHIRAGRFPYTPVAYTDDVSDGDSLFIATFDPPAVIALITRLEQAEQAVQRVREMAEEMGEGKAFGILTRGREDEYPISYFIEMLEEALDGDGRE